MILNTKSNTKKKKMKMITYKPDNITIYKEEKFYSYQEAYNKQKNF